MLSPLEKPRLVLRVGVAGAIELPESQRARLHELFTQVYRVLATRLEALAPGHEESTRPDICSYYASGDDQQAARPLMRVVSGLADGTDQIAFESLLAFECDSRTGPSKPGARTDVELVAILPCDAQSFRDNSTVTDKRTFDELLARCAHTLELDGWCVPHAPRGGAADRLTTQRRNRAFRVQAAALLRHCDLLIANADLEAGAGIGGTRETMATAVALGIPVLWLSVAPNQRERPVTVITRPVDLERTNASSSAPWERSVDQVVTRILADPRTSRAGPYAREGADSGAARLDSGDAELLDEFFGGGHRRARLRPTLWSAFVRRFHRLTAGGADTVVEPFARFRARAAELSAHYTGLYRGAFLVNYTLAALAVALAVTSLVYLLFLARHGAPEGEGGRTLLSLAIVELAVLVAIFFNTHLGNSHHWNSKAVDYRYLAERLRAMQYLSPMALLRLAPPRVARYAVTALRQSVVDWLLQAVIREAPPGTGMSPLAAPAAHARRSGAVSQSDVDRALALVHDNWLATQIEYHRATSHTQRRMHRWIRRWVWRLNLAVIIIVFADLLLIVARLLGLRSGWVEVGHSYGPVLVFFAAVLPAVVSSLNSIRFQSECLRIAERSAVMVEMLEGCRAECEVLQARVRGARASGGEDPGGWTLEAYDLGEACAQMLSDEVAEWSVLYSRDLLEA